MSRLLKISTAIILFYVSLPTFVVLVSSFSGARLLTFPPQQPSLSAYGELFRSELLRAAMIRSIIVGAESALIALIIGTPTSLALYRYSGRVRALMSGYLTLGFAAPLAVSAVAFVILYYEVGVFGSLPSVALALAIVNFPFLLYAIAGTIEALDPRLSEAAATLGAEKVQVFLFVTLPGLAPGIMTGTVLVFIFGVTDILTSLILTTVRTATLPVVIYGSLRTGATPLLAAAGGFYILMALVVVFVITRLRSIEQFLYRSD